MRTILGLMILTMAVMVMGCSEPTTTTDANGSGAAATAGCDCCSDCDKCEDGKKCECTSKDGSDCDCKCEDGAAEGETVSTEVEEAAPGSGQKAADGHSGSDHKEPAGSSGH